MNGGAVLFLNGKKTLKCLTILLLRIVKWDYSSSNVRRSMFGATGSSLGVTKIASVERGH